MQQGVTYVRWSDVTSCSRENVDDAASRRRARPLIREARAVSLFLYILLLDINLKSFSEKNSISVQLVSIFLSSEGRGYRIILFKLI